MAKQTEATAEELMNLPVEGLEAEELESLPVEGEIEPGVIATVLKGIEKYGNAPMRAGLMQLAAKGVGGIPSAAKEAAAQFGEEPAEAPTMREVMQVAGVPETKIPIPEIEPGLAVSIPTEQMQALVGKGEVPTQAPASEIAATAGEQVFDPTAALIHGGIQGAKAAKFALPAIGAGLRGLGGLACKGSELAGTKASEVAGGIAGGLKDLPTGETMAKAGRKGAEEIFKTLEQLPADVKEVYQGLKPKIRSKYIEQFYLANRTGIDPDLIKKNARLMYGEDAFVTKKKASDLSLGVQTQLGKDFDELQSQIGQAITQEIERASGSSVSDPVSAGNQIAAGYKQAVDQLFQEADTRYSNITEKLPDLTFTHDSQVKLFNKLALLENQFKEQATFTTRASSRGRANANLEAIQRVASNLADGDIKTAIKQMQEIGRTMAETPKKLPEGVIDTEWKVQNDLYNSLKDAVMESVKSADEATYKDLVKSNELQAKFFEKNESVGDIINSEKLSPEKIYQKLVAGADSKKLEAINYILGNTDAMSAIKSQVLHDRLKLNAKDVPLYGQMIKQFNDPTSKRLLSTLFQPSELNDLKSLLELGMDAGNREFNPPKSGVFSSIQEAVKSPAEWLEGQVTGKGFVKALETSGYRDYFKDMPLSEVVDLRTKGIFDDALLDEVIKERATTPEIKAQIKAAAMSGSVTPDVMNKLRNIYESGNPSTNWTVVRDYMNKTGQSIGLGLVPGSSPFERSTKMLMTINRLQREQFGDVNVPVMVPEEDRASVKDVLIQSDMNPIQKAKNIKSLNTTGYLLDTRGFTKEEQKSPVMNKLLQKGLIQEKQKAPELKEDKPDVLKALERKAGQ